jgi:hypothetical protein
MPRPCWIKDESVETPKSGPAQQHRLGGTVKSVDDFHRALGKESIGKPLALHALRGVYLKSIDVTPGERK